MAVKDKHHGNLTMHKTIKLIINENKDITGSECFGRAWEYKHHIRSNVASHSLMVALLCYKLSKVFRVDRTTLVRAALLHDLGMVDNRDKWSSRECAYEHPKASLSIAEEYTDNVIVLSVISNHMFPLAKHRPKYRYARLFNFCDKTASVIDTFVVVRKDDITPDSDQTSGRI